jgi:endonuclease/exonuclease/phosphatase family metal-dependent hydrolase
MDAAAAYWSLRVLSFNILAPQFVYDPVTGERYVENYPIHCNLHRRSRTLVRTLRDVDADVILLQEVQDIDLDGLTDTYHVVHARHRAGYWGGVAPHGNAVLIRRSFDVCATHQRTLSPDGNGAVLVRCRRVCDGCTFVVACVHLEDEDDALRDAQMQTLVAWLPTVCDVDDALCIVGGDWNSPPTSHSALVAHGFATPMCDWTHKTSFDAPYADVPVDAIYTKPLQRAVSVVAHGHGAVESPHASLGVQLSCILDAYGSDHLPVWVDLVVGTTATSSWVAAVDASYRPKLPTAATIRPSDVDGGA